VGNSVKTKNNYLGKILDVRSSVAKVEGKNLVYSTYEYVDENDEVKQIQKQMRQAKPDEVERLESPNPWQRLRKIPDPLGSNESTNFQTSQESPFRPVAESKSRPKPKTIPTSPPGQQAKIYPADTPLPSPPQERTSKAKFATTKNKHENFPGLDIREDVEFLGFNTVTLRNEYRQFLATLESMGLDTSQVPKIRLKTGHSLKTRRRWLGGLQYQITIPHDTSTAGYYTFRQEIRKAMARCTIQMLKKQQPAKYRQLANPFYRMFKKSRKLHSKYIKKTKDRKSIGKAIVVRQGYWKSTYKNPMKPAQLGRIDKDRYRKWTDECASVMAEALKKGGDRLYKDKELEYNKAVKTLRFAQAKRKATPWHHLAIRKDSKRAIKRAKFRVALNEKMLEKVKLVRWTLNI